VFKFMIWMTVLTTVGFIVLMIFDYKLNKEKVSTVSLDKGGNNAVKY
jgi:hypothetical protein